MTFKQTVPNSGKLRYETLPLDQPIQWSYVHTHSLYTCMLNMQLCASEEKIFVINMVSAFLTKIKTAYQMNRYIFCIDIIMQSVINVVKIINMYE